MSTNPKWWPSPQECRRANKQQQERKSERWNAANYRWRSYWSRHVRAWCEQLYSQLALIPEREWSFASQITVISAFVRNWEPNWNSLTLTPSSSVLLTTKFYILSPQNESYNDPKLAERHRPDQNALLPVPNDTAKKGTHRAAKLLLSPQAVRAQNWARSSEERRSKITP